MIPSLKEELFEQLHMYNTRGKSGYSCFLTLVRACAAKGYCSRSVGRSVGRSVSLLVCLHVFSWIAAVDNVDMWVCATDARYSKSLEQCCQKTVRFRAADRILSICLKVFSLTVAVVDAKRRYVGRYATGAWHSRSQEQCCRRAASFQAAEYYPRCALIRDCQPTGWL